MDETPSFEAYAEFGDQAEIVGMLFMRATVNTEGLPETDDILEVILSRMLTEPQLERIVAIIDEEEAALAHADAAHIVVQALEKNRGCLAALLAWIPHANHRAPAEPAPAAKKKRPDYDGVRAVVKAAIERKWTETIEDAFAEYDAMVEEALKRIAEQN